MLDQLSVADLTQRLLTAFERQDRGDVNAIVRAMVARRAPLGQQWRSLAVVMTQNGEHRTAVDAIRLFAAQRNNDPRARLEEVFTLHAAGRVEAARRLLASLPPDVPDRAGHAYLLGSLHSMAGARDEARAALEAAVRLSPDNGQAWLALATLDQMPEGAPGGDALVARDPRRTGRRLQHEDAYFYGLGKVFDDRRHHAEAFDAFSQGAARARAAQPFDFGKEEALVARVARGFERSFIDKVARTITIDTRRPIFVTGNPRSGTTLVEQILTSHSAVADGGELDVLRIVGQEIGGPRQEDFEQFLSHRKADELAALYLHLLDERFGSTGRIVDKRLLASRTLGLIASILPQASLIWLRRDPLDNAWSAFRTYFNQSAPWSHDLATIARHFRLEDRLLAIWQTRLGERLLVVPYEELVTDAEAWTRRILAHCELAEEPAVFAPHKTQRAVMTASVMQVREPINRRGIGAADPYREFMKPFTDVYFA